LLYELKRRMYRGDRPSRLARALNEITKWAAGAGLPPQRQQVLEVRGRRSGRLISFPIVVVDYGGERYLVSMLGARASWVANVRAAGGHATLRHGGREPIALDEVEVSERAPILKRYLELAPGARPHVAVPVDAPLTEFERVAKDHPVFRIRPDRQRP
jgi:F420H(2)-dependent quinone reductase